jgi:hypothetical protein
MGCVRGYLLFSEHVAEVKSHNEGQQRHIQDNDYDDNNRAVVLAAGTRGSGRRRGGGAGGGCLVFKSTSPMMIAFSGPRSACGGRTVGEDLSPSTALPQNRLSLLIGAVALGDNLFFMMKPIFSRCFTLLGTPLAANVNVST